MRRSRSLVKSQMSSSTMLIGLALVVLIIWLIKKSGIAQYNEERVVIERDSRGRIAALSVHRSAHGQISNP